MKAFWWSRTFWVNVAFTLVAMLTTLQNQDWIADNPAVAGVVGAVIGVINVVLRFVSRVPIGLARR